MCDTASQSQGKLWPTKQGSSSSAKMCPQFNFPKDRGAAARSVTRPSESITERPGPPIILKVPVPRREVVLNHSLS